MSTNGVNDYLIASSGNEDDSTVRLWSIKNSELLMEIPESPNSSLYYLNMVVFEKENMTPIISTVNTWMTKGALIICSSLKQIYLILVDLECYTVKSKYTIKIFPDIGSYLCVTQMFRLMEDDDDSFDGDEGGENLPKDEIALLAATVDGKVHPFKIQIFYDSDMDDEILAASSLGYVLQSDSWKKDNQASINDNIEKESKRGGPSQRSIFSKEALKSSKFKSQNI